MIQILHATPGHTPRWNYKTIVLFDMFVTQLNNGSIMQDHVFEFIERTSDDSIIAVKCRGHWLLVDNGYLNWGTTTLPTKSAIYASETRWSEQLDSMRKDVEYTFGTLKGRQRIIKSGIRLHGVDVANDVWITSCALRNMLL